MAKAAGAEYAVLQALSGRHVTGQEDIGKVVERTGEAAQRGKLTVRMFLGLGMGLGGSPVSLFVLCVDRKFCLIIGHVACEV